MSGRASRSASRGRARPAWRAVLVALCLTAASATCLAQGLRLAVPPFDGEARLQDAFAPLAGYLAARSGNDVRVVTYPSFVAYWLATAKGEDLPELTLDMAPHASFRLGSQGYDVLAKLPGNLLYSIAVPADSEVGELAELLGRPVASPGPPSLDYLVLNNFFSNPIRRPTVQSARTMTAALEAVRAGQAAAAMFSPTLVARPADFEELKSHHMTPNLAFTAAADVDDATKDALRQALLDAADDPEGARALEAAGLPGFERTSDEVYQGYDAMMVGAWGS